MNRPTRNTLFGMVLCLVLAAVYASDKAFAAGADHDFDLVCAIVSAAEAGTETNTTEVRRTATTVSIFFLGRLSGRDGGTYWHGVVVGRLSEMKKKARDPEMLGRCTDFFSKQL